MAVADKDWDVMDELGQAMEHWFVAKNSPHIHDRTAAGCDLGVLLNNARAVGAEEREIDALWRSADTAVNG